MNLRFPLNVIFHHSEYSLECQNNLNLKPSKAPNILLSQVPTIPIDIIVEFENLQIFDLEDLVELDSNNDSSKTKYLNISKIKQKVINQSQKINNIPVLTMEIPKNYAIIAMEKKSITIDIALNWKGLIFLWLEINHDEIEKFLENFRIIISNMNNPELVTDTREWSFSLMKNINPSDISVYLSNFDIFSSLERYCNKLSISYDKREGTQPSVINQIHHIEFILWYATKMKR